MRLLKRVLLSLLVLLIVIAAGFGAWFEIASRTRLPRLDGEIVADALGAPVQVLRDDWGIPHITAESEADAYFALGYCMAQDRLFQMELFRRLARGELAELLGPKLAPVDKVIRLFRLRAMAERYFQQHGGQHPELKQATDAFIAGINHFVATEPLPVEFTILQIPLRPYSAVDALAVAAILPITFSYGPRQDPMFSILQERYPDIDMNLLFPGYSKQVPATILETFEEAAAFLSAPADSILEGPAAALPAPAAKAVHAFMAQVQRIALALGMHMGSNSWVLAPSRSATGGAILANDPHIGFTNPSIWYEAQLRYGDFNLYGYHLPLIPIPLLGHNEYLGWGLTMFANDDVDMFIERVNPENPEQVMYRGQWVDMTVERETIAVRWGAPIEHEVRSTPHGPLVTDVLAQFEGYDGPPVSLFWVWQHVEYTDMLAFYRMTHARNIEQFQEAVALVTSPGVNVSYADRDGNIAWWAAGKIPVRPPHVNSKRMLNGASGLDELLGYVPFDQNPHAVNPPWGFIATANNKSTVKPVGAVRDLEGYWQPWDRAARIEQLIASREQWSLDELKRMQVDSTGFATRDLVDAIAAIVEARFAELNTLESEALARLEAWSGAHEPDEVGPAIYNYTLDLILANTLRDELGDDLYMIYGTTGDCWNFLKYAIHDDSSPFWDDRGTPETETRASVILASFRDAVARLSQTLGSDVGGWTWGRVHTMEFKHPFGYLPLLGKIFNIGPFPSPGGGQVINNMLYPHGLLKYDVVAGPSTRRLIDFSQPDRSFTVLPTGNSGNFRSAHYADQAPMFMRGDYREVRFTEGQVAANAKHRLRLVPAGSTP